MRRVIKLTEDNLHRIVEESLERLLNEGKIENWGDEDFVTWDDVQYYCNHSYETVERNEMRCDKLGIPQDQRCYFCQKALNNGYKTLYTSNDHSDIEYYAQPNANHRIPVKVGKTCAKAFEKAHADKYGY